MLSCVIYAPSYLAGDLIDRVLAKESFGAGLSTNPHQLDEGVAQSGYMNLNFADPNSIWKLR